MKPDCDTCTRTDCTYNPKYHDEYKELGEVMADETIRAFVKWNGCFNHPQAREYLMTPVIAELERRQKIFGGDYGVAYRAAILLIKGMK